MEDRKKEGRYGRIYKQLSELVLKSNNTQARMATVIAVLHHKMDYFFWTGYYLIEDGEMTVNSYQDRLPARSWKKTEEFAGLLTISNKQLLLRMYTPFPVTLPATRGQIQR